VHAVLGRSCAADATAWKATLSQWKKARILERGDPMADAFKICGIRGKGHKCLNATLAH
jgi:hypothetical protein